MDSFYKISKDVFIVIVFFDKNKTKITYIYNHFYAKRLICLTSQKKVILNIKNTLW